MLKWSKNECMHCLSCPNTVATMRQGKQFTRLNSERSIGTFTVYFKRAEFSCRPRAYRLDLRDHASRSWQHSLWVLAYFIFFVMRDVYDDWDIYQYATNTTNYVYKKSSIFVSIQLEGEMLIFVPTHHRSDDGLSLCPQFCLLVP